MYKAITPFVDGENGKAWPPDKGGLRYAPGDPYPGEGFEPTQEHIGYLLGSGNKFKAPCIEAVEEPHPISNIAALSGMKKPELEALAAQIGLDAKGRTVKELIALIEEAKAKAEEAQGGDA